ncbi:hypothetical protein Cadr_000021276 [Camelus dromedarius]|uniref:Uncharacterized protein n=1 Tax=Camelus dromedarius TaxID=9838 RepID=A0A5N4CUT8_CAMDR|nr:hypothetical protein Cadr_000021276 [Camelus dromedarius]
MGKAQGGQEAFLGETAPEQPVTMAEWAVGEDAWVQGWHGTSACQWKPSLLEPLGPRRSSQPLVDWPLWGPEPGTLPHPRLGWGHLTSEFHSSGPRVRAQLTAGDLGQTRPKPCAPLVALKLFPSTPCASIPAAPGHLDEGTGCPSAVPLSPTSGVLDLLLHKGGWAAVGHSHPWLSHLHLFLVPRGARGWDVPGVKAWDIGISQTWALSIWSSQSTGRSEPATYSVGIPPSRMAGGDFLCDALEPSSPPGMTLTRSGHLSKSQAFICKMVHSLLPLRVARTWHSVGTRPVVPRQKMVLHRPKSGTQAWTVICLQGQPRDTVSPPEFTQREILGQGAPGEAGPPVNVDDFPGAWSCPRAAAQTLGNSMGSERGGSLGAPEGRRFGVPQGNTAPLAPGSHRGGQVSLPAGREGALPCTTRAGLKSGGAAWKGRDACGPARSAPDSLQDLPVRAESGLRGSGPGPARGNSVPGLGTARLRLLPSRRLRARQPLRPQGPGRGGWAPRAGAGGGTAARLRRSNRRARRGGGGRAAAAGPERADEPRELTAAAAARAQARSRSPPGPPASRLPRPPAGRPAPSAPPGPNCPSSLRIPARGRRAEQEASRSRRRQRRAARRRPPPPEQDRARRTPRQPRRSHTPGHPGRGAPGSARPAQPVPHRRRRRPPPRPRRIATTLLLRGLGARASPGDSELGRQFRDWCLRTYGDSAKPRRGSPRSCRRWRTGAGSARQPARKASSSSGCAPRASAWQRPEPKMGQWCMCRARAAAAGLPPRLGAAGAGWGCGCVLSVDLARPDARVPAHPSAQPARAALRVRGVPAPLCAAAPAVAVPGGLMFRPPVPSPSQQAAAPKPKPPPARPGAACPGASRSRPRAGWAVVVPREGGTGAATGRGVRSASQRQGRGPARVLSPRPTRAGPGRAPEPQPGAGAASRGWLPPPWDGGGLTYPSPPLPRPRGRPGGGETAAPRGRRRARAGASPPARRPGEACGRAPALPRRTSLFCSGWGLGGAAAPGAVLSFELSCVQPPARPAGPLPPCPPPSSPPRPARASKRGRPAPASLPPSLPRSPPACSSPVRPPAPPQPSPPDALHTQLIRSLRKVHLSPPPPPPAAARPARGREPGSGSGGASPRAQGTGLQAAGRRAAHLRGALITAPLPLRPPAAHLRRCRLRPDPKQGAGPRGAPGPCPNPLESGTSQPKSVLPAKPRESGSLSPPPSSQGPPPPAQISSLPLPGLGQPSPSCQFRTLLCSPPSWASVPSLNGWLGPCPSPWVIALRYPGFPGQLVPPTSTPFWSSLSRELESEAGAPTPGVGGQVTIRHGSWLTGSLCWWTSPLGSGYHGAASPPTRLATQLSRRSKCIHAHPGHMQKLGTRPGLQLLPAQPVPSDPPRGLKRLHPSSWTNNKPSQGTTCLGGREREPKPPCPGCQGDDKHNRHALLRQPTPQATHAHLPGPLLPAPRPDKRSQPQEMPLVLPSPAPSTFLGLSIGVGWTLSLFRGHQGTQLVGVVGIAQDLVKKPTETPREGRKAGRTISGKRGYGSWVIQPLNQGPLGPCVGLGPQGPFSSSHSHMWCCGRGPSESGPRRVDDLTPLVLSHLALSFSGCIGGRGELHSAGASCSWGLAGGGAGRGSSRSSGVGVGGGKLVFSLQVVTGNRREEGGVLHRAAWGALGIRPFYDRSQPGPPNWAKPGEANPSEARPSDSVPVGHRLCLGRGPGILGNKGSQPNSTIFQMVKLRPRERVFPMQISVLHGGFPLGPSHARNPPIRAPSPKGKCQIAKLHSRHQAFASQTPGDTLNVGTACACLHSDPFGAWVTLQDQVRPSHCLPASHKVLGHFLQEVGQHVPPLPWARPGMNVLSSLAPTGCLPLPECLGIRRPIWNPENVAGMTRGWGAYKGQVSDPASGKPRLLLPWRECVCIWMCVQKCGCVDVSVHVPVHVQAGDACVPWDTSVFADVQVPGAWALADHEDDRVAELTGVSFIVTESPRAAGLVPAAPGVSAAAEAKREGGSGHKRWCHVAHLPVSSLSPLPLNSLPYKGGRSLKLGEKGPTKVGGFLEQGLLKRGDEGLRVPSHRALGHGYGISPQSWGLEDSGFPSALAGSCSALGLSFPSYCSGKAPVVPPASESLPGARDARSQRSRRGCWRGESGGFTQAWRHSPGRRPLIPPAPQPPNPPHSLARSLSSLLCALRTWCLSTSPMFPSPCHVPDTLFHLISPGSYEVDEKLASERPGNLPEPHSEQVAGPGFCGWSDRLTPRGRRAEPTGALALPTSHLRLTVAPHLRTHYKSFLELEADLPAWTQPWGREMPSLLSTSSSSHLNHGYHPCSSCLHRLQGAGRESSDPLPARSLTPSASSPLGHPGTWGSSAADGETKAEAECESVWFQSQESFILSLICSFHCPPYHSSYILPLLRPHLAACCPHCLPPSRCSCDVSHTGLLAILKTTRRNPAPGPLHWLIAPAPKGLPMMGEAGALELESVNQPSFFALRTSGAPRVSKESSGRRHLSWTLKAKTNCSARAEHEEASRARGGTGFGGSHRLGMVMTGATFLEKHVLQSISDGVGMGKWSNQLENHFGVLRGMSWEGSGKPLRGASASPSRRAGSVEREGQTETERRGWFPRRTIGWGSGNEGSSRVTVDLVFLGGVFRKPGMPRGRVQWVESKSCPQGWWPKRPGDSGLSGISLGVSMFTGPLSQSGTFPAPAGTRHRLLGGLICSRRHGALPLAGQALTGCWQNPWLPQSRRPQPPWADVMTPFYRLANQGTASAGHPARQQEISVGQSSHRAGQRVTWPTTDLHLDPSSATSSWFWASGSPAQIPSAYGITLSLTNRLPSWGCGSISGSLGGPPNPSAKIPQPDSC